MCEEIGAGLISDICGREPERGRLVSKRMVDALRRFSLERLVASAAVNDFDANDELRGGRYRSKWMLPL